MHDLLNEVMLPWCEEIMFGRIFYFVFWKGPVDAEQIEYCDKVSKEVDTSDCGISDKDFWWLQREFGPFHADTFALVGSWRMKPFLMRIGCGEIKELVGLL